MSRRTWLLGGAGLGGAALLDAFAIEPRWLQVTEHVVPVPALPRSLEGYTVAQATDVHLGALGAVQRALTDAVRGRAPQLVVLTGDIVNDAAHLGELGELVHALRQPGRRLIATLGNWEHWGHVPLDRLNRTYSDGGAELLVNRSIVLDGAVAISATDDSTAGAPRLDETLAARRAAPSQLFLTHSPSLLDRVPRAARFDLALSGHTHGGQARIWNYAPILPPGSGRFVAGWYDVPSGRAYVSRGIGTSVVPARVMCRPELPLFRLVRA